jgi:hypothetical protein
MMLIGVDYHPSFQQIAFFVEETGEYGEPELQAMYEKFKTEIEKLNQRFEQQARERSGTRLLMTHPGAQRNR